MIVKNIPPLGRLFLLAKSAMKFSSAPNVSRNTNMFQPICDEKGLRLVIEEKKGEGVMVADKVRINQITLNLFSNAVKYTSPGGVITYSSRSRELPNNKILYAFELRDTGIGMSEEFQKTMFI